MQGIDDARDWLLIIFLFMRSIIRLHRYPTILRLSNFVFQRVSSSSSIFLLSTRSMLTVDILFLQKLKYHVLISISLRFRKYVPLCFSLFAHTYPVVRFSVLLSRTNTHCWYFFLTSKAFSSSKKFYWLLFWHLSFVFMLNLAFIIRKNLLPGILCTSTMQTVCSFPFAYVHFRL